jgi:hypothetical protein|tara:strand:+ start:3961 stop:4194 length:234 start_codon:yes stop_codon:yes gene_type:complete
MATAPPDVLTTVSFRVKYWTTWGQNLVVVGSHAQLGEWDVRKGIWMHCEVRFSVPITDAPNPPGGTRFAGKQCLTFT